MPGSRRANRAHRASGPAHRAQDGEAAAGLSAADLSVPGPGEELIAHLTPVLATLDQLDRGEATDRPAGPEGSESSVPRSPGLGIPVARLPNDPRAVRAEEGDLLLELFDAQVASRWLDVAARRMRAAGQGFYTIGSSGHEVNAAVALGLRRDDPALLHYRSGAFYLARSGQVHPEPAAGAAARRLDGIMDVALGLAASAHEPIAGGRHKVFGHPELAVIPQTSTIASHLPRALGVAWAIGRQRGLPARLRRRLAWPDNAVVVASFGDASANHSTAAGAINSARWAGRQGIPVPLLLVCEDNGLGISTRTPPGWIETLFADAPGLEYCTDDGEDPVACLRTARAAVELARDHKVPVLLHLSCVRLGGHAGSDVETAYRTSSEITTDLLRDPVAATMRALVVRGVLAADEVRRRWAQRRDEVGEAVAEALRRPRLTSLAEVRAPLAPRRPEPVAVEAARAAGPDERRRVFADKLPEHEGGLTLAAAINRTLLDAGAARAELVVLGEDVARKGGVYGVTRGLLRKLGASRVIDTVLDEQTVLGLALGAGVSRAAPGPGDPVPGLPAQCDRPAPRRGGDAAVLLPGCLPQPAGGAGGRAGLSEGVRRALPQRQRDRGAPRDPRRRDRLPRAPVGRSGDAAHLPGRGHRGRHRQCVRRADRALPRAGHAASRGRRLAGPVPAARGVADGACPDRACRDLG